MTEIEDVEEFLRDFKAKLEVWGLEFKGNRNKNKETLLILGITARDVQNYLKLLKPADYCSGPQKDTENQNEYWVFGLLLAGSEIYIKINIGKTNYQVICISFHVAEYTLEYPFKKS